MKVKENILISQGQEPLLRDVRKAEPELARTDVTNDDSVYLLPETNEEAIELSNENCNPKTDNTCIYI
jgi:hypothetical protein